MAKQTEQDIIDKYALTDKTEKIIRARDNFG